MIEVTRSRRCAILVKVNYCEVLIKSCKKRVRPAALEQNVLHRLIAIDSVEAEAVGA
jgi:hypothetical protein